MTAFAKNRNGEKGGVLIFILLAVGLLAALAFAITQGGRDSTQSLSDDKRKLVATEIMSYGDTIKSAVSMLRLRGITVEHISFAHNGDVTYGTYGASPTMEVFNPAGGGVVYSLPDSAAFVGPPVMAITGATSVQDIGTNCNSDSCSDLIFLVSPLSQEMCTTLNEQLGITGNMPAANDIDAAAFTGTFQSDTVIGGTSATDPLRGKQAGCYYDSPNGAYYYYQVLLAR